jgi:hypothetical protein
MIQCTTCVVEEVDWVDPQKFQFYIKNVFLSLKFWCSKNNYSFNLVLKQSFANSKRVSISHVVKFQEMKSTLLNQFLINFDFYPIISNSFTYTIFFLNDVFVVYEHKVKLCIIITHLIILKSLKALLMLYIHHNHKEFMMCIQQMHYVFHALHKFEYSEVILISMLFDLITMLLSKPLKMKMDAKTISQFFGNHVFYILLIWSRQLFTLLSWFINFKLSQ